MPSRQSPAVTLTVVLSVLGLVGAVPAAAQAAPRPATLEVASVTVGQFKVVGGDSVSGSVTLNQSPASDVQVIVSDQVGIPEVVQVQGNPITIPAGSSSADFTVTTGATATTQGVILQGLLADGSSTVTPSAEFFIMPSAETDLIEITKATMSKRGTLTVAAVSDTSTAVLSATFNGEPVPGESRNGTLRGKLVLPQPTSGIVEVTSDLDGCAQRNPFGSGGSQVC